MASLRLSVKTVASVCSLGRSNVHKGLLKSHLKKLVPQQAASIAHKNHLDPEVIRRKPKPWPYTEKKYTYLHQMLGLDRTIARFDENTVVITVDGNMGAGKSKFAQQLAEELGMKHFGEPDWDKLYVDHNGFDYRSLNQYLPEDAQYPDLKMFHTNPENPNTSFFQCEYYRLRFGIYVMALAHLFSTGQGVVIERNPWSDRVFMETFFKHGYIIRDTFDFYCRLRKNTIHEVLTPHVAIYLDLTPEESWKRLQEKNGLEAKSKVLNLDLLKTLDENYRKLYLPEIAITSELLVYDAHKEIDIDFVVEELEKVDFSPYEWHGDKLQDWRMDEEEQWSKKRRYYCNEQYGLAMNFLLPVYDVDGMFLSTDAAVMREFIHERYGPKLREGYNPKIDGWSKVLFKFKDNYWKKQMLWWTPVQEGF